MTSPSAQPASYTLEVAQQDIATLRGQLVLLQSFVSTVNDKAVLLYAPGANAIPRGPTKWSFEDGTVDGWTANSAGAVSNSTVTAPGWPTDGTHSLLLTANGSAAPFALSPAGTSGVPTQPGDPVTAQIDIYCPAGLSNVYVSIAWLDDTGTYISQVNSAGSTFTAGQVLTLTVSGTAPDLCAYFDIMFGDSAVVANGTLIYADNVRVQGNLKISVSAGGGTDSVGNPYPAGIQTATGTYLINAAGTFWYSSAPATGNLIASTAPQPGTDLYGNKYLGSGYVAYSNNGTDFYAYTFTGLSVGAVGETGTSVFHATSAAGPYVLTGGIYERSSAGATAQTIVTASGVITPQTSALFEVQGVQALTEQGATPATPTGAGYLYVDATGHLHYLGPSGTNTIVANP